MGSGMQNALFTLLVIGASITAFVLFVVFVAVPLFKGVGMGIGWVFRSIGWFFSHIFEFIFGTLRDLIRFVGSLIAMIVLLPLVPLNIVIGRWSAASHFAEGVKRECHVGSACIYRAAIRRPLKLLLLDGLVEGLEQRVPEAMHGAPTADKPSRRVGQYDGYTIVGSLRAGGSGAKLYIAEPDRDRQNRRGMPPRVVIKSFALTEGSSLPQIVRESRALECAKQLGHILDHGMDEHRFFYVMPYHPGDHLGILTRQMHGECSGNGLDQKHLTRVTSYMHDLLATLSSYHKGGLWHKDVKPENVIVHDGQAHLVDLGLVTPLRSAMTLTTHGTEYFRDPEMVRQALRGVKVHQVNGAKFDIYAAGAVLYFMIENTFPAHGGLSRFATKSPEALRWIVRRAMTEYNQRYSTADEMLADVDYVMSTPNAFSVKPVDLPSMRGDAMPAAATVAINESHAEAERSYVAASATSPNPKPFAAEQVFAAVGAAALGRPKLTVTNWWTGEYRAEQPQAGLGLDDMSEAQAARILRKESFAFRQQAEHINRQVRSGVISARKAAREQLKAAKHRAKEMRTRAAVHRKNVMPRIGVPMSAAVIGTLSVLFLLFIITMSFLTASSRSGMTVGATAYDNSTSPGKPILLALDSDGPITDSIQRQIKRIVAEYRDRGYDVVDDAGASTLSVLPAIRDWKSNPDGALADGSIENFLESQNAYGLLHVSIQKSKKSGKPIVQSPTLVYSTRPDADQRRRIPASEIPPAPALPYLLINDHPAKSDLAVAAEIERNLKAYRQHGWILFSNDDVEVKVRNVLPIGPIDAAIPLSPVLHATLAEANLGGILRIDGKTSDGSPNPRITLTRIDRDLSIPALPPAADAPTQESASNPIPPTNPG